MKIECSFLKTQAAICDFLVENKISRSYHDNNSSIENSSVEHNSSIEHLTLVGFQPNNKEILSIANLFAKNDRIRSACFCTLVRVNDPSIFEPIYLALEKNYTLTELSNFRACPPIVTQYLERNKALLEK